MNDIKIGQLYQHTPTGIVRRVVFVGDNYVTLKKGDYDYSQGYIDAIKWLKSLKDRVSPQNFAVTDEELAQAKKDAYNDALDKIEYHSGEPTFDDGWSAAIDYIQKKSLRPQPKNEWSEEDERCLTNAIDACNQMSDEDYDYSRFGNIENFKKFWRHYEAPNDKASNDKVNHPSHYTWLKDLCGIEVIDITRHMDFNLGNSIKYILRSGHKKEEGYTDKQKTIEDLKKAIWYLNDEIKMLENKK